MERISSFFLMGYAQRNRTSFKTCMKKILILINKYANKHKHENEAPGRDLEPRFRVKAYFHIYWSK
jgi:hypothetical protein